MSWTSTLLTPSCGGIWVFGWNRPVRLVWDSVLAVRVGVLRVVWVWVQVLVSSNRSSWVCVS